MEAMQHMEMSDKVDAISAALVEAQAVIRGAARDSQNPHLKNRYADLTSVMEACKPALNAQGIAIVQAPVPCDGNKVAVETMLLHKSGQWLRGRAEVPMGKVDPQGYGSAMTYARRYSLAAMAGVCPDDDDGNAASNGRQDQRQQQPTRPQARPAAQQAKPAQQQAKPADQADPGEAATEVQIAFIRDVIDNASDPHKWEAAILKAYRVPSIDFLTSKQADDVLTKANANVPAAAGK